MPYFRCPSCHLLVHLASIESAEVACSRCRVRLQQEPTLPPRELASGLIGHSADEPSRRSSS